MKKLLSLFLLIFPLAMFAQVGGQQSATLSNPFGGNIIASSTNCSVAGACIWQKLPATATTTTITITGTFSATLQIETSADGGNTFTNSSTQTAPAVITITTTSLTDVRVRCSAYTSGSAGVNIQTAGNQLNVTVGGSSSGGGGASANQLDPTQAPYNVKADAVVGNDGSTIVSSNVFSAASRACTTADTGKLIIVTSAGGGYPYGNGLATITGCSGSSYLVSTNAGGNNSNENWAIGTDANPVGNPGLSNAWHDALTATPGKTLALPCGAMIVSTPPFTSISSVGSFFMQRANLQGCNSEDGTIFIIHPNIAAALTSGGTLFSSCPSSSTGLTAAGVNGNQSVENVFLTSLGGVVPKTSGQAYTFISGGGCGVFRKITAQLLVMQNNGGTPVFIGTNSEAQVDRLNFQNANPGGAGQSWIITNAGGQGANTISNSIFAFSNGVGISYSGGTTLNVQNVYTNTFNGSVVAGTAPGGGTSRVMITGSCLAAAQGIGSVATVQDGGVQTSFYVFGNGSDSASNCLGVTGQSQAAFNLSSSSILDVSGTDLVGSAGNVVTGSGTINDRVGNTFSGPLTNFTGTYIPIGGGSLATNKHPGTANTNFGTTITATNIIAATLAGATYDVKIGIRQTTLGVGCSVASNTALGTLNWTLGGLAQSATLNTLTISGNGAVGTSNIYQSIPVSVDINTAITFTISTSTLASTGCSTTPQYAVDFSTI